MATDSISVTYTDGLSVAASIGITVTGNGKVFTSLPSNDANLVRRVLRYVAANYLLNQIANGTITKTISREVPGLQNGQ